MTRKPANRKRSRRSKHAASNHIAPPPPTSTKRLAAALSVLFLLAASCFAWSLEMRQDLLSVHFQGHLNDERQPGPHHWLTAQTILHTNHWVDDGPLESGFALIWTPKSVETPTLESRVVYQSFPPGAIAPIYFLTRFTGKRADVGLVIGYNLFCQFVVTLLLSLTLFSLLTQQRFGLGNATALAAIPIPLALFTPMAMYFNSVVYLVDQAVLPLFAFYVFLETMRTSVTASTRARRIINALQAALMFCGVLTDYLFLCVAGVVWLVRVVRGQCGRSFSGWVRASVLFWAPAALALGLFMLQLYWLGELPALMQRALERSGVSDDGRWLERLGGFFRVFWLQHVPLGLGKPAVFMLWGGLAVLLFGLALSCVRVPWSKTNANANNTPIAQNTHSLTSTLALMACVLLPCLLQVYLLRQNSAIHNFSVLKFTLSYALLPVLAPLALIGITERAALLGARFTPPAVIRKTLKSAATARRWLPVVLLPAVLLSLPWQEADVRSLNRFFATDIKPTLKGVDDFINQHTGYADVLFSPIYPAPIYPPHRVAFTMKIIHPFTGVATMKQTVAHITEPFTVAIFLAESAETPAALLPVVEQSDSVVRERGLVLYKIDGGKFLREF